ncbi:MAG: isochorismatase family protein [Chloroflexi bacterium]|nr:isochorismatase family protein [Chloroflexota bacterium]
MASLDGPLTVNARPLAFALEPVRTAVIVVDMQNDFASEGGSFARGGRDITMIRNAIAPTARVLGAARSAGIRVIYLKSEWRPDLSDLGAPDAKFWAVMHRAGIGEPVTSPDGQASRLFITDTWNTEIVRELSPEPSDIVVVKRSFNGFYGTELDAILRGLGIKHLVFTGCTTSVCVESTLRDAMFRDYRCLLLADCTAEPIGYGLARSNYEATLLLTELVFGWVSDSVALLEALTGLAAGKERPIGTDPVVVVQALDAACNVGDLEAVLALFAANAVVTQLPAPPDGGVYRGKEQVRQWFAPQLAGFHAESQDYRVIGESVTWKAKMLADVLRQMGLSEPTDARAEAVVQDGKIASFTVTNLAASAAAQGQAVVAPA